MTRAEIIAAYPDLPPGLTAADDVALWSGLHDGLGFEDIAVRISVHSDKLRARFAAFRDAAGGEWVRPDVARVFREEAERRLSRG
jgi:hypothetical protein